MNMEKRIKSLNNVINIQSKLRVKVKSKVGLDVYNYTIIRNIKRKVLLQRILIRKKELKNYAGMD